MISVNDNVNHWLGGTAIALVANSVPAVLVDWSDRLLLCALSAVVGTIS